MPRSKYRLFIATIFVSCIVLSANAQGDLGDDPPPCWPPPCIPIDGGVGVLIAAGALLGGRKALELRRSGKTHP
jgi:hypothetical protein